MTEESRGTGGLFESLKALSLSIVGIVHTRLELLSTDIAEAREHLITLLLLLQLALFFLGIGVLLLALLIVVVFWESHRLLALGVEVPGKDLSAGRAQLEVARGGLSDGRFELRAQPGAERQPVEIRARTLRLAGGPLAHRRVCTILQPAVRILDAHAVVGIHDGIDARRWRGRVASQRRAAQGNGRDQPWQGSGEHHR